MLILNFQGIFAVVVLKKYILFYDQNTSFQSFFFSFSEMVNNNNLKDVMCSTFKLAPVKDFVLLKSGFLWFKKHTD